MMPAVSPKKPYTFHIDSELAEGLKALKEKHGTAESESIRRAIAAYLREMGVMKTDRKRATPRKRS
jgi:predicted DNA-binding protein